jgi:putative ABC transport system substrate-binding protein
MTMRRRQFLAGLGSTAIGCPLAARAQQPSLPVIGFLDATELDYRIAAFRQGLKEMGYIEDHNVVIDYRGAEGQFDRLPAMAADLVHRKVAVLVTGGGAFVALMAEAATDTIPTVFTIGADPVASGLVTSLSRPTDNITGVSTIVISLSAKQIEMLHEAVPNLRVIGFLDNPNASQAVKSSVREELKGAADALGLKLIVVEAAADSDFDGAFASLVQNRVGALLVSPNPFFTNRRHSVIALAAAHSIPAMYSFREYVSAGGLMSYGTSLAEGYRIAGTYAGRILKGEKPGDLPVQLASKVELTINLRTAKMLGITFPLTLLGRADEVIE